MTTLPGIDSLPQPLREPALRNWQRIPAPPDPAALPAAARVLACSDFVAGACAADRDLLHGFVARGWDEPGTREAYDAALAGMAGSRPEGRSHDEAAGALRRFRRAELARIAWRDLAGLAGLETSLQELSDLADACINAAYAEVEAELVARHGTPRDRHGRAQRLVVLAMGKLGAHELNFSSDVDLVFAFPENGDTDGDSPVSNEEYFNRFGRRLIRMLDLATADGFVYRVDMRLRPFGDSGPLALSFGALESYYQEQGRDWERYALIKARPVTGDPADGARLLELLRPFVFRRYLDYGSFEQLRRMKAKIERHVAREEMAGNIKLGPGGIREIEFIGQAFQLIRGGREPVLQERRILRVLDLVAARHHLAGAAAAELKHAYGFLRRVENRMQAQADRQVHELPEDELGRLRLAHAMGCDDWPAFERQLGQVRQTVTRHFDAVFLGPHEGNGQAGGAAAAWRREHLDDSLPALSDAGFADAQAVVARLEQLRGTAYWRGLGDDGRARLDQLMPMVLDAAAAQPNPDEVFARLLRVVEAIDRRISYLALLIENPKALDHLARLCSASTLFADRVARSPLLLDELLDTRIFTDPPTRGTFEAELDQMLAGIAADDLERQMDTLRVFQQAAVLRVAVADLTGMLPLMKVSDRLTELAEVVLERALALAWSHMVARHGRPGDRGFAVVGYGKLGGLELAYGSDLDLVFLHDADSGDAQSDGARPLEHAVYFARLGQRIVHLLATPTGAGVLYEVDTRLRPSGASGLLVSSMAAFGSYQRGDAWTWEHQALLRARPVAGTPEIGAAFRRLRLEVLSQARHVPSLREEVARMRARMREELAITGAGLFDLKQGAGGISDIEFLVQFLVLAHAHDKPELLEWTDNIRQLEGLTRCGILETRTGAGLADAYRALRERIHRLGLQGERALVDDDEFGDERALVTRLWEEHLGV